MLRETMHSRVEIIGLRQRRSCALHDCCGERIVVGDLVRFKYTIIDGSQVFCVNIKGEPDDALPLGNWAQKRQSRVLISKMIENPVGLGSFLPNTLRAKINFWRISHKCLRSSKILTVRTNAEKTSSFVVWQSACCYRGLRN
uniref:Uncharacterized protein n=1 Tax=Spongospora subterranea TaxID=70186 RepID=A0A0H5R2U8_9EUKA|eukprot:CRZ08533.1 hypothetical protein [Spongospora subterranea]